MALHDVEPTILRATGGIHPLNVTFIDDEDLATPWKRAAVTVMKLPGTMCQALNVTLANLKRCGGEPIRVGFAGNLRADQESAVSAMLHHDAGVLCAPTAYGMTVTAAAIIARRGVNTLVLVHRTELLKQWQARLQTLLALDEEASKFVVGTIGGGKAKPSGKIDIAVMQSLSRQGEVNALVEDYGQVIVDECHHVGAASFDAILKRTKAKFVLGLTATPIRRNGQHPIIFVSAGRSGTRPPSRPVHHTIWPCCRDHGFRASTCRRQPVSKRYSDILCMIWPELMP